MNNNGVKDVCKLYMLIVILDYKIDWYSHSSSLVIMSKVSKDNLECECETHGHNHPTCTVNCTCHNNGW